MSSEEKQYSPIFIHSLFRSGSTYFFNVFRRSGNEYWCYQEPEHELLVNIDVEPESLLIIAEDEGKGLRHPALERPYFWEFYQVRESLKGLFRKSFSYEEFFVSPEQGLSSEQFTYFNALIKSAKARPVLQCCRTVGRVAAMKQALGGVHIHLWREPRNQWWSFKVNDYFDAALQLIFNARGLPQVLQAAKNYAGIIEIHCSDAVGELGVSKQRPLGVEASYYVFFALWLYVFLESEKYSDISIGVDSFSKDANFRSRILERLSAFGIEGLDFSDCNMPVTQYTESENKYFKEIESRVINLYLMHGYERSLLAAAVQRQVEVLGLAKTDEASLLIDAARAREVARWNLDLNASVCQQLAIVQSTLEHEKGDRLEVLARLDQSTQSLTVEMERRQQIELQVTALEGALREARQWASAEEQLRREVEGRAAALSDALQVNRQQLQALQSHLDAMFSSTSWRITRPLRIVATKLRWPAKLLVYPLRISIRLLVLAVMRMSLTRPELRRVLHNCLSRVPYLDQRLRRFARSHGVIPPMPEQVPSGTAAGQEVELSMLTASARRIYSDLQHAIKNNGVS